MSRVSEQRTDFKKKTPPSYNKKNTVKSSSRVPAFTYSENKEWSQISNSYYINILSRVRLEFQLKLNCFLSESEAENSPEIFFERTIITMVPLDS